MDKKNEIDEIDEMTAEELIKYIEETEQPIQNEIEDNKKEDK